MIIERQIGRYIVFSEGSILDALRKIGENKSGFIFVVSGSGLLEGILTDGDLRRWLVSQQHVDLDQSVLVAVNRSYVACREDAGSEKITSMMSDRIRFVPLLDSQGRLIAVASRKAALIRVGEFSIGEDAPSLIIAEIGNNHNGSLELAMKLVDEAIAAGADCAKFQLRDMASLYRNSGNADDHSEDLGAQYTLDLLSRFQLANEEMFKVFDYCKSRGILPLCTPWDFGSLAALESYGIAGYKLASADFTNHELITAMAACRKPMICSTGMCSEGEIQDTVRLLRRIGAQYVLLHCNSTYPAPFKDINLNYLDRLKQIGDCPVGYSGHERGIAVAIAAVSKGAKVIEKHFTLDRSMEGSDHRVSLLPAEFRAMADGIREVELAMGSKETRKITQGEMMNREVLGKSLVINRDLLEGEVILSGMIEVRSPGKGLSPYRKADLIGRIATHDMAAGEFFYPSDLEDRKTFPRPYKFRRPFGIPVRYHDFKAMAPLSNYDLMEFHLSYKDLDLDPKAFLDEAGYDLDLVVHSPELFAGDHIMDLCSLDPAYRKRSIEELQRVVDVTRSLKPFFHRATKPMIVINAGGVSQDRPISREERGSLYELIAESLGKLDTEGVEIIPQTMPPFPWHFGGQRFHNLFMDDDDIVAFCRRNGYRVCLDLSHSKLACTQAKTSFDGFLNQVGPFTAHLHVVDARGVDGEGLQIGEGEIDFKAVAGRLDEVAPAASFIPEIWQGHKNGGAGFWEALERLEEAF